MNKKWKQWCAGMLLLGVAGGRVEAGGPGKSGGERSAVDGQLSTIAGNPAGTGLGEANLGELLARDDFQEGARKWRTELEKGGVVAAEGGVLDIDVPGGCTVWWQQELTGPVVIEYEARMIAAGGANDRVSDLNCFWMARDDRSPTDLFATARSGKFPDYDQLRCYYVGYGGNNNTTSRFRRYIGEKGNRPLLPEHDLAAPADLLVPNEWQRVRLVAAGSEIAFYHDDRRVFYYHDPQPYVRGWFAFRTVRSHFQIRNFRVTRWQPDPAGR